MKKYVVLVVVLVKMEHDGRLPVVVVEMEQYAWLVTGLDYQLV